MVSRWPANAVLVCSRCQRPPKTVYVHGELEEIGCGNCGLFYRGDIARSLVAAITAYGAIEHDIDLARRQAEVAGVCYEGPDNPLKLPRSFRVEFKG